MDSHFLQQTFPGPCSEIQTRRSEYIISTHLLDFLIPSRDAGYSNFPSITLNLKFYAKTKVFCVRRGDSRLRAL
jgi:hypothetical protein